MSIRLALVLPVNQAYEAAFQQRLDATIDLAGRAQFQGLELLIDKPEALAQPAALRQKIEQAGLHVASIAMPFQLQSRYWQPVLQSIRSAIAKAGELGAHVVTLSDEQLLRGKGLAEATAVLARRLADLGQIGAAERPKITVAMRNAASFSASRALWSLCETARAAAPDACLGVAWNAVVGAAAGEHPERSVPTLNSRIVYGTLWDANAPDFSHPTALGAGDVRARVFLERLRGIGYKGWIAYDPQWTANTTHEQKVENVLAAAPLLHAWSGQTQEQKDPGKKTSGSDATIKKSGGTISFAESTTEN